MPPPLRNRGSPYSIIELKRNRGLTPVFDTSASLMLCENADPDVRRDLETILARLAPDGDRAYRLRAA